MNVRNRLIVLAVLLALLLGITVSAGALPTSPNSPPTRVRLWLTILHNNDGESQVVNAGSGLEEFGGAAAFKTVVDQLRFSATRGPDAPRNARRVALMLSSGDNFLAGPEFNVGLQAGVPFPDTVAMELIGYDAVNLGNHDFDFGPDVLAQFLDGYGTPPPYVAANLDFSDEPALQAYVDAGVIRPAIEIWQRGFRIGIIGLNTPNLPFVSSPRNVVVNQDIVTAVRNTVSRMTARGVDIIILTSHLQDIQNEVDLIAELRDIDIVIAGGGDELLANPDDLLLPGDAAVGPYPIMATDRTGRQVPIVTTSGEYRYVGRLTAGFDRRGKLIYIDESRSGPVRVATGTCNGTLPCDDAVTPDPTVQSLVVDPVVAGLQALEQDVIANSEVVLDGTRATVRTMESNQGNLLADALLWAATREAPNYGAPAPDVAIQNSGGIRNNTLIAAGDITALDTFDIAPFPNFVSIVPNISREQFKEILENTVACTQPTDATNNSNCGTGRFPQIGGFMFEWSASGDALIMDLDLNVLQAGTRVRHVELDDGTVIVDNGVVVPGDPIVMTTNDFSARGGDQYPFRGLPFINVGSTYQQALENYIKTGLSGQITAAQYPEGGEGRIVSLP